MQFETERLLLIPLTASQLNLWLNDLPSLEKELNCSYQAEPMVGFFREIVAGQHKIVLQNKDDYIWHSFWFIIRKSDRVVVGSIDFKSTPNDAGEVEIGYGLGKEFEHQGYMTETVKAMCTWAKKQAHVTHIIAETEIDNLPSQRILTRCGFVSTKRDETIWWKL